MKSYIYLLISVIAIISFNNLVAQDTNREFAKEKNGFADKLPDNWKITITSSSKNYIDKDQGFSITFPENWILSTPNEPYFVVRCETPDTTNIKRGTIKVLIMDDDVSGDLKSMAEKSYRGVKTFLSKDFTENKVEKQVIDGNECLLYDISYNYKRPEMPDRQRNINYYFAKDGKIFSVSYWGQEDYYFANKALIDGSLLSFKIIK